MYGKVDMMEDMMICYWFKRNTEKSNDTQKKMNILKT